MQTTFMSRYFDGSPRPRLGWWTPDGADMRFLRQTIDMETGKAAYDDDSYSMSGSTEHSIDPRVYDVAIYPAVEDEIEMHCLISGRRTCPRPMWMLRRFDEYDAWEAAHRRCYVTARTPLEVWLRDTRAQLEWQIKVAQKQQIEHSPFLTDDLKSRYRQMCRERGWQISDPLSTHTRETYGGVLVPSSRLDQRFDRDKAERELAEWEDKRAVLVDQVTSMGGYCAPLELPPRPVDQTRPARCWKRWIGSN